MDIRQIVEITKILESLRQLLPENQRIQFDKIAEEKLKFYEHVNEKIETLKEKKDVEQ